MRPTIVFSSSDSSEYDNDEKTPIVLDMSKKNTRVIPKKLNDDDCSISSVDYSSEISIVTTARPINPVKRPIMTPKKNNIISKAKSETYIQNHKVEIDEINSSFTEGSEFINPYENPNNNLDNNMKSRKIKQNTKKDEVENNNTNEEVNETQIENEEEDVNVAGKRIELIKDSDFEEKEENIEEIKENADNENNEEDENINPPIVKIHHIKAKPSITYAIFRKLKSSIRGKRYYYYFYSNSNPIYCAKAKTRHPDTDVPICEGTKVHIKGQSQYILSINRETTMFSLRKGDKPDEEMLSLKFYIDTALLNIPKHIDIQVFSCIGAPQITLTTKKPKVSSRGSWILDFHDKFTIPSEKNMIFVSSKDKDGPDLLLIRKISSDGMEIDLCTDIPEIGVFAIGLSIFLTKFH